MPVVWQGCNATAAPTALEPDCWADCIGTQERMKGYIQDWEDSRGGASCWPGKAQPLMWKSFMPHWAP